MSNYIELCDLEQSLLLKLVNVNAITLDPTFTTRNWYSHAIGGIVSYSTYLVAIGHTAENIENHLTAFMYSLSDTTLDLTEKVDGFIFPDGVKWEIPPQALQAPTFGLTGYIGDDEEEEEDDGSEPYELNDHIIEVITNGRVRRYYLEPHETNQVGEPAYFDAFAEDVTDEEEE